ncbi:DUF1345 domain-containing protein [Microbacterium sp. P06]|uniref:DUF1345 domain-containing protein n=1 Tax=unclassified Microbacterium TaxID=2609290 RepID=UPI003744E7EC
MSDPTRSFDDLWHRAALRVGTLFGILIIVTVTVGAIGSWAFAPAVGWIAACGMFLVWEWITVLRLGPADTASHATREDPTRTVAQTLLILASIASFGAIALVLAESGSVSGADKFGLVGIALLTVAASWCLVHVLFTLRYAAIYYRDGGEGIDFNQTAPPQYRDFAYFAFTLGMTYQVSDTNVTSSALRREVLRHALLSFVLGVVVLAATINLVAALVA